MLLNSEFYPSDLMSSVKPSLPSQTKEPSLLSFSRGQGSVFIGSPWRPVYLEATKRLLRVLLPLGRDSSSCYLLLPQQLTYSMYHSKANSHCLICLGKMFTHSHCLTQFRPSLMNISLDYTLLKEHVRFINPFLSYFFKQKNHTWKAEMIPSFV